MCERNVSMEHAFIHCNHSAKTWDSAKTIINTLILKQCGIRNATI